MNEEDKWKILNARIERVEQELKEIKYNKELYFNTKLSELEQKLERSYTCPFDCEKAIEELEKKFDGFKQSHINTHGEILERLSELEKKYNTIGEKIPETIHKYYTKNKERIEKLEKDGEKEPTDDVANITQIIEIYDNGHEHEFYPDTHVVVKKADLEWLITELDKEIDPQIGWRRDEKLIKLKEKYLKENADDNLT